MGMFLFLKNMRSIALDLFQLLHGRLFARTEWQDGCGELADIRKYEQHVDSLIRICDANDWIAKYPNVKQRSERLLNLLNGEYSLDAQLFFSITCASLDIIPGCISMDKFPSIAITFRPKTSM